jgi:hypothetical protein
MKKLVWLCSLMILAIACQEDQLAKKDSSKVFVDATTSSASVDCTEGASTEIVFNETVIGSVSVSDASSDVAVNIDITGSEYFLLSDTAWAGSCEAPALVHSEALPIDDEIREHSFSVSLANLPECGCARLVVEIGRYNPRTSSLETYIWEQKVEYCKCPDEDKPLRTQTPGGWGAVPRGENPGTYVHDNFDDAFPNGLQVGCDYTISLTSAQAVTDFLPNTGNAAALTQDYVDSGSLPGNILAGHVVALKLSVTFDAYDEDFGEASSDLADAVVTSGPFAGWTVAQVLAEGEKVLGGCDSEYDASELTDVLSSINESFVDGTTDTGFLDVQ